MIVQAPPLPPLSEGTYLRAGWIPQAVNGVIPDVSGMGKTGTPLVATLDSSCYEVDPYFGPCLRNSGNRASWSFSSLLSVTTAATFGVWYKVPSLDIGADNYAGLFTGTTGNDLLSVYNNGNCYLRAELQISGVARSLIDNQRSRVDVWELAVWTYDGDKIRVYIDGVLRATSPSYPSSLDGFSIAASGYFGGFTTLSTYGFVGNARAPFILNRCWSDAEVAQYYNVTAKVAAWKSDYGALVSLADEGGTIGAYLSNTPFQFGDAVGRFRVETATINGRSTKVITCNTAGVLYLHRSALQCDPGAAAFGETEFWIYKTDAGAMAITLNNTGTSGAIGNANEMYFAAGEEVGIQRYAGGAWAANNFQTAAGYCPVLTWTKFTAKRTVAGIYTAYMNDALITPVAAGANPATDATYLTSETTRILMGVGCKIALGSVDGANAMVHRIKAPV